MSDATAGGAIGAPGGGWDRADVAGRAVERALGARAAAAEARLHAQEAHARTQEARARCEALIERTRRALAEPRGPDG